jgi:hypothetical protein
MAFSINDFPEIVDLPQQFSITAWLYHIPMAPILMKLLRPRTFVELGTYAGDSYLAFCRAVKSMGIGTQCSAIDTWQGDAHVGAYSDDVLRKLRALHDQPFGDFSRLIQSTFEQAAPSFVPQSIDLLHIDGAHTYDDVKRDVDTWFPKLSDRGVAIFQDTADRTPSFGVWRVWEEVRANRPHMSVQYGSGLGVLAVGANVPQAFLDFLQEYNSNPVLVRLLEALGQRVEIIRNALVAVESLHTAQSFVNEWRTHTNQQVRNSTPNMQYAWQSPVFFGPATAEDVRQLGADARNVLAEVMQHRQRVQQFPR